MAVDDKAKQGNGAPSLRPPSPSPPRRPTTPFATRRAMMSDDVPAAPNPNNYSPDEILLYGVPLNTRDDYATLPLGTDRLRLEVRRSDPMGNDIIVGRGEAAIALIYGYAFEGHCYRLDRPKVLLFSHPGGNAPADGCGFDTPYRMWRIRKKTPMLELSTSFDFAE